MALNKHDMRGGLVTHRTVSSTVLRATTNQGEAMGIGVGKPAKPLTTSASKSVAGSVAQPSQALSKWACFAGNDTDGSENELDG